MWIWLDGYSVHSSQEPPRRRTARLQVRVDQKPFRVMRKRPASCRQYRVQASLSNRPKSVRPLPRNRNRCRRFAVFSPAPDPSLLSHRSRPIRCIILLFVNIHAHDPLKLIDPEVCRHPLPVGNEFQTYLLCHATIPPAVRPFMSVDVSIFRIYMFVNELRRYAGVILLDDAR
jgi:hypothetical protein